MISEVARRYAKALFDFSQDHKKTGLIFSELQQINQAFASNTGSLDLLNSPTVSTAEKNSTMKSALGQKASQEIQDFFKFLIEKHRMYLFPEIVDAFESIADSAQGVTRGTVKSATTLGEEDRRRVEQTVTHVTNKKVILNYEEDKSLLGGLVAQVGGWTFDDSLRSHLNRISEDLNRRTN